MENLTCFLQTLHNALLDGDTQLATKMLQQDVAAEFNKIAELVSFEQRPNYSSKDITDEDKEELESKEGEDGSEYYNVIKNAKQLRKRDN